VVLDDQELPLHQPLSGILDGAGREAGFGGHLLVRLVHPEVIVPPAPCPDLAVAVGNLEIVGQLRQQVLLGQVGRDLGRPARHPQPLLVQRVPLPPAQGGGVRSPPELVRREIVVVVAVLVLVAVLAVVELVPEHGIALRPPVAAGHGPVLAAAGAIQEVASLLPVVRLALDLVEALVVRVAAVLADAAPRSSPATRPAWPS
jgi:hypothetical protein